MNSGIPLPKLGDIITIKYIPEAEHNIVLLPYMSAYLLDRWEKRLSRLKDIYEAFPDPISRLSYGFSLIEFLEKFRTSAEPKLISRHEADLRRLGNPGNEPKITTIREAGLPAKFSAVSPCTTNCLYSGSKG